MLSNRLAFAALGVVCIAAAAGGGYLATRQNAVPVPASAAGATSAPTGVSTPATTPDRPAQDTEASAGDTSAKPAAPSAAVADAPAARIGREMSPAHSPEPRASRAPLRSEQMARHDAPLPDRTAPGGVAGQTPFPQGAPLPTAMGAPAPDPNAAPVDDHDKQDPPRNTDPPRLFEELVVPADSVIGLQTDASISSERARVEDRVDGRVTRDVRVNSRVAIPAGTRAVGTVMLVERGGKFKERARLGIRFDTLVLADGTKLPISTETIYREGDAPTAAAKVGGGAVGGAILGAILGGGKGALIGGMAGAGAGSAATAAGGRNAAVLPAGATLTVRMLSPVTVTLDK